VTGTVCTVALGGFALWFSWVTGSVADVIAGRSPSIVVRAPVTLYLTVGYLPMAIYYLNLWTTNHLESITRQFALARKPVFVPRLTVRLLGVAGVVAMYFLFIHSPDDPLLLFQPARWFAGFVFPLVGLVFMGWFNLRFMFLLVWSAVVISRTAPHIHSIDLLDTSLVKPYAQHGVRSSLLAVVSLSISTNL